MSGLDFKYGDLIVKCHQCGAKTILEEAVTDGRAIYLFNKNDSYLKLHCDKCNITMEMCMEPSVSVNIPTVEEELKSDKIEEVEYEELPQEAPTKEIV